MNGGITRVGLIGTAVATAFVAHRVIPPSSSPMFRAVAIVAIVLGVLWLASTGVSRLRRGA